MDNVINDIDATEEVDRKELATVVIIKELNPIPNKDRIELVVFEDFGYTCIAEKGIHKIGDNAIFIREGSIVPDIEIFDWMANFKFRVKPKSFTIRDDEDFVVDKIYSQGILMPFYIIEQHFEKEANKKYEGTTTYCHIDLFWEQGKDVTDILGIKKYIPPPQKGEGMGNMLQKGDFPTHLVSKTDEDRLANKMRSLEELDGLEVIARVKMEGSSITLYKEDGELEVCSRNTILKEVEGNKFWIAANRYNLKETMPEDIIIQGELMGPGIQKNKLGLTEVDFYVFNVYDKNTRELWSDGSVIAICEELGLKICPEVCWWEKFVLEFDTLQKLADTLKYENGVDAEGMVIRPVHHFISKVWRKNWSAKVLNRNYVF